MKSQTINHKKKVVLSKLHDILRDKFSHQEKQISYVSIPKISIYLIMFLCFVLFPDIAFLNIQMQMTFEKLFNVSNNTA